MDYTTFLRLLAANGKESRTFDRKEMCHAFQSRGADGTRRDTTGAKGELAKDICAMANNGDTSYLMIGISDDGTRFTSVANENLTDENLQTFCKEAITPPVRLTGHRSRWPEATGDHAGKTFVIIEIGPHPRDHIFRLQRNYIVWGEKVCYRRNEVWVRRGETSDLASPEEIVERMGREGRPELSVRLAVADQDVQAVTLVRRPIVAPTDDAINRLVARAASRLSTTGPMAVAGRDIDAYRDRYRAYLRELFDYEENQSRYYDVRPVLRNSGTHPADDVTLTLRFEEKVLATADDLSRRASDLSDKPEPPALPPPLVLQNGMLSALHALGHQPFLESFVPPRAPLPSRPRYRGPFIDETSCDGTACTTVIYEADSIQHDGEVRFRPFVIKVPKEWQGERLDASCTIKARQQRQTRHAPVAILFSIGEPLSLESLFHREPPPPWRIPEG